MTKNLRTLIAPLLLIVATAAPSLGADERNVVPGRTSAGAPLGLHGVDPVAFVELGNRLDGSADHVAVHEGVAYYFATEANRKTFRQDPERYVPQNGGFCTFGVSVGKKFDGDPRYAAVEDGRLYVFLNEDVFRAFQKDPEGTLAKARTNWARIEHLAAGDL